MTVERQRHVEEDGLLAKNRWDLKGQLLAPRLVFSCLSCFGCLVSCPHSLDHCPTSSRGIVGLFRLFIPSKKLF